MPVARTRSIALLGLDGAVVDVEASASSGLPAFVLIGLADAALGEAKDRVRSAAANSGMPLSGHRMTVNLSPASLPKHGSGFDLAVALAALAAEGVVPADSVARTVHLGELGLDGRLRAVRGVLPAVLAARRHGAETVMVPSVCADEARLVPGIRVVGVPSLAAAALWHGADLDVDPGVDADLDVGPDSGPDAAAPAASSPSGEVAPDLADIVGNADAVEALVAAAAGGHHLLLLGPPGAGKTMLAARLPGILPDLDPDSALEVGSLRSLSGLPVGGALPLRPPIEAPHHSASTASIVGGGSGQLRPGAAARASHGVLFLDESQ